MAQWEPEMNELAHENIDERLIDDKIATQKDLKILKLELLNQLHQEIAGVKSYLLSRLGTMIIGGFTMIGILGWIK
jgi:hypothetical protein